MAKVSTPPLAAAVFALATAAMAAKAPAQSFEGRSADEVVQVRILPGWRQADGRHMAAIQISLAPGWKTYWRAPGEGGIPPQLRLTGISADAIVQMHWPRPEVFYAGHMRSIGYHDEVIFPLEVRVGSGPVRLDGQLDIGVCLDVCMPVTLPVSAELLAERVPDPRIVAALSDRPLTASEAGAGPATCRLVPISDGFRVEARIDVPETGNDETVVFEHPNPEIWIDDAESHREGGTLIASTDLVPSAVGPMAVSRRDFRITVLGSHSAIEFHGCSAG